MNKEEHLDRILERIGARFANGPAYGIIPAATPRAELHETVVEEIAEIRAELDTLANEVATARAMTTPIA